MEIITEMIKEGEHYVMIAPSINVSGYGYTEKEANESFNFNMGLFLSESSN